MTNPDTFAYWALCLPLTLSPMVQADDSLGQRTRFGVPMSCAAFALIRSADYPEAFLVYDERHEPRSFEEADRAALAHFWRHRGDFAEEVAVAAFRELFDRPPTDEELCDERSRWVRSLMSNPKAVGANCEALYEVADRSCQQSGRGQN